MNLNLLKGLDLAEIDVPMGKVILEKDDRGSSVYVLLSGSVAVTVGDHLLARETSPGTIFGEVSALLGTPIVATVKATEASRFHVIENFTEFLKAYPDVAVHVAQTLAYRLVYMNEHFVQIREQIQAVQKNLANYLPVFSRESLSAIAAEVGR